MAQPIAGILLDLGETLLTFGKVDAPRLFEEGSRLAYDRLRELGFPLPSFRRYHCCKLLAIRWAYCRGHALGRELDAIRLLRRMHRRLGMRFSRELAMELASLWYEPLRRRASVEPGTARLLRDFRDSGLVLGLVSNTFVPAHVLESHLASEGLLEFLPVRVYSCDTIYRKPHPRIFRAALERTGLDPARTLYVGDRPWFDVHGANRVGMISVLKDPGGRRRTWFWRPRHRIARLEELRGIVEGYRLSSCL
jgi:HAD superfamily hydrolase (TIGR01509 family)